MSAAEALRSLSTPFIDTRTSERRPVRIADWSDVEREIERIVLASAPDGEGLRVTGNWSAGQIFEHLAITIDRSIDGFPTPPRSESPASPGLAGVAARARRAKAQAEEQQVKAALLSAWQVGASLPSIGPAKDTAPPAQVWTPHGAEHLRGAIRRIADKHPMDKPSPAAGRLSPAEWEAFHLRHAAWHLAFILLGERR